MKHVRRFTLALIALLGSLSLQAQRTRVCLDDEWRFALGNAASAHDDFGCGTEYFNYLTKAASIHNTGPYARAFNDDGWQTVRLPHDWAVDLPFAPEASHSHGYKTVGWKYPEHSIGWYRKWLVMPQAIDGQRLSLVFDGAFRNSQVWVNGFFCGGNSSGYTSSAYDITDYVNAGDSALVCVRVDASLEEGWFYEGAGLYRHVWLDAVPDVHVAAGSMAVTYGGGNDVHVVFDVSNQSCAVVQQIQCTVQLIDDAGRVVCQAEHSLPGEIAPKAASHVDLTLQTDEQPQLWSPDSPYLYTVRVEVRSADGSTDVVDTRCGLRTITFDPDRGLLVNGNHVKLKGACLHQDHAGVGAAIPDELYLWRCQQLKQFGFNAIRSSHNPMAPALLDICDSLGILVVEENRLLGTNDYHLGQLASMIRRDINHPSIIAWSMGNEEWGVEWNSYGERIVRTMTQHAHLLDPSRPATVATSGGPEPVKGADVAGYNYMMQNPIDQHRANYPQRVAYCSEETTGCGTRSVYFHERGTMPHGVEQQYDAFQENNPSGRMPALNRCADRDGTINRIERGWQFQAERPWLCGLFYWTGFDYRGESNPLVFPATGSSFGLFDYCGFPKDEAYYLRAWWQSDEPQLHLLPHWNLQGHEGDSISVWAYSNCDEVQLTVNGRNLGRKAVPRNGHVEWQAVYRPGYVQATGYRAGRRVCSERIETTGRATQVQSHVWHHGNLTVVNLSLHDDKGRFVPTASLPIDVVLSDGEASILGWGNGDSAYNDAERPATPHCRTATIRSFNGRAQILIRTANPALPITFRLNSQP